MIKSVLAATVLTSLTVTAGSLSASAALLAPISPLLGITAAGIMLVNASGIRNCRTCQTSSNDAMTIGAFIGLVLLDGENGQELSFQALDEYALRQLGISTQDRLIYNSEVEKLNQVAGAGWLSHSGEYKWLGNQSNVGASGAILTIDGLDVKLLFQKASPNLRYLALIGCSARNIIERYKSLGYYKKNPNLVIQSFEKKIDAKEGLRYSLNVDMRNDLEDFSKKSVRERETTVRIVRDVILSADKDQLTELLVSIDDQILAVFPQPQPGDYQEITAVIPERLVRSGLINEEAKLH